ncbi:unnamed protein product [Durusdinium trenchii]|uniref:Peptidase M28 domain-containing protein n=2 Tax=Durusdinium trenchii TaxID=1381693 RepID=A0ABP0IYI5_9DINO
MIHMARPCALFVHLLGNFWLGDSLREHSSFRATNPESESAILDEVTNNDGKPNPRISCSAGIEHARQLLAGKMKAMGLMALGQGNDYLYTVPGTKDDECPGGITNLIAGLPGSDEQLKEEYILLGAHLDGPYNQGPSAKEGNLETDNSYDDGGSVAAVLSLAKYFKDNPIKRSLLLILSDGEEGIGNVQTSEEWKRRFCQSSGWQGRKGSCHNYPIGFTAWARRPTVQIQMVKLVMTMDPLGAPGINDHDFVAVLGTESTEGLQELMEESFTGAPVEPLFVNRQYAATSYSDADAITKDFKPLCVEFLPECFNGVPAVWLAQTAFGKYHGGVNANYLLPAMEYGMIPGIKVPRELASFALDMRKNFNDQALLKVTESLTTVLKNLGNQPDLSYLVYNPQVHKKFTEANAMFKCGAPGNCGFSLQDAINNKKAYDYLAKALLSAPDIAPEVAKSVQQFSSQSSMMLGKIINAYGCTQPTCKPSEVFPKELEETKPGLLAVLTMALDFYAKEPYRQPFGG